MACVLSREKAEVARPKRSRAILARPWRDFWKARKAEGSDSVARMPR